MIHSMMLGLGHIIYQDSGCQGSLGQDSLVRRDSVPFVLATSEVDSRPSATERV